MTKSRISLIIVSILLVLAFIISSTLVGNTPQVLADTPIEVDAGPVVPSPVNEIYTKYPDYYFFSVPGAVKYRVKVYNYFTDELIYKLKGDGDCDYGYCYLKPELGLKFVDISGAKGYYYWTREAKLGEAWVPDPTEYNFRVYSPGFTSLFTTADAKWKPVFGTWSFTTTGYLKTKPVQGEYTSIVHKHKVTDDYSYEVKMRRKDDSSAENFIIVKGFPDLENSSEDGWYQGISFGYNNAGNCRLDRWNMLSRQVIYDWEHGCNVKYNDWNVLSIYVHDGVLYAYMNGVEVYKIADDVDFSWVGIGGFEDDSERNALQVDYARVWYP